MTSEVLASLAVTLNGKRHVYHTVDLLALTTDQATKLLTLCPDRLRPVEPHPYLQPALTANGFSLTPVYWETATVRILGPTVLELFGVVGAGDQKTFWIVATYQGDSWWVRSDRLRSKQAFVAQQQLYPVDLIRSFSKKKHTA